MEQQTSSMTDEALLQQLGKQARMYVQSHTPINVEALPEAFETDITPRDTIFMRNNHDLLTIDAQEWQLTIDGAVEHPLILDYAALTALPRVKHVAFLECYGNGRKRFAELGTPAEGVPWGNGAIANVEWEGASVAAVLQRVGLSPDAVEIECRSGGDSAFVRGVEIAPLLADAIFAYRMNGEPLPPEHGGPVRLVVPGWGGINWVKWLTGMTVLTQESQSPFNQESYILLDADGRKFGKVREIAPKAMIVRPSANSTLTAGPQRIQGFAWAARGIERVEISTDGGLTWQPTELAVDHGPYSWRRFEWQWDTKPGTYRVAARAIDQTGQHQAEKAVFNKKGYLMNAIEWLSFEVLEM